MRLSFWKKKPDPNGPMLAAINALQTEIRTLSSIQARGVFPASAMNELTGELRALRYLLDPKGRFAFMDSVKAKEELDAERKKLEEERAAAGGKGGSSA